MTAERGKRAAYTLAYKLEAVRLVQGGQTSGVTAKVLGIPKQTLENWVRQAAKGKLTGAGAKPVSAEQMELARLRAELARVKMERDILKKAAAYFARKYAWIERHKNRWPVTLQCEVLNISTSGYFERQRRKESGQPPTLGKRISDEALLVHIKAVHAASKGEYGWPRIWRELQVSGVRVWKERVRRLMKEHGIKARGKRKFVVTTDSTHNLPIAPNLLNRNFQPDTPDAVWTSDITYIQTGEGWLYLAVVLDLYSRRVVGWSMQAHMQTSLVTDALRMAWFRRRPEPGLIFHSDRGSQYCSHVFQGVLAEYGMQSSMSRKGNCWDNAPTESLWGSLKVGRLYGMRFETRRQAMDEVIDWLTYYNRRRLHSTLGYISPMQFEKNWFAAQLKKAA